MLPHHNPEGEAPGAPHGVLAPDEWHVDDRILNTYKYRAVLGEWDHGTIYRVHHLGWDTDLEMRSLRPDDPDREALTRTFTGWAGLGAHPHIVSCYYVREVDGAPKAFIEYIAGASLADWIEQGQLYEGEPAQIREGLLDVAIQAARGLAHAHAHGLAHGDVKPANIMLTPEGIAKVTNFGLGETPAYCSPEQAAGEEPSLSTDAWGWGLVVLEMFSGQRTWQWGHIADRQLADYRTTGPANQAIPRMSAALAGLLKRCFQKNPASRPTMPDIISTAQEIYQQETGSPYRCQMPTAAELQAATLNNQALGLLDQGQEKEAEEAWRQALQIDRNHLESTYNHSLRQWRRSQMTDDHLVEKLEHLHKGYPYQRLSGYLLGLVHLERGNYDAAIGVLQGLRPQDERIQALLDMAQTHYEKSRRYLRTYEGHQRGVTAVCLSTDGHQALSGSSDRTLILWDVDSGQPLRRFVGHTDQVNAACLNREGTLALSGSSDKTLRIWNVTDGRCLRILRGHTERVWSVYWSEDGHYALSGSDDRTFRLWDIPAALAGAPDDACCLRVLGKDDAWVNSVCLSRDGRYALSSHYDHTIKLWDTASGDRLCTFVGHRKTVTSVCLSQDATYALSGSFDGSLKLWDVAAALNAGNRTGRALRTFRGHTSQVNAVCLSKDCHFALSGGYDDTVRLWQVDTGRCLHTFRVHRNEVHSVYLSDDGQYALSGSADRTLIRWRVGLEEEFTAPLIVSRWPDGRAMASARHTYRQALVQAREAAQQGDFTAAARHLRTARAQPGARRVAEALQEWHQLYAHLGIQALADAWLYETQAAHTGPVMALAAGTAGHYFVSGGGDGTIKVWRTADDLQQVRQEQKEVMQPLLTLPGHQGQVTAIALSGDARHVLSGGEDQVLRWWTLSGGPPAPPFRGHTDMVHAVCLSRDGRFALSGSADHTLRLWDTDLRGRAGPVPSGHCLRVLEGHEGPVFAVCLTEDGSYALSAGADQTIKLWLVRTGECVHTFRGHTGAVRALSLGRDGHYVLSGSDDQTCRLWDLESWHCRATLAGHQDRVLAVSLSPAGRCALSAGQDRTVRAWDLAAAIEGKSDPCLRTWEHATPVRSLCMGRDGRYAVWGGEDGTVQLYVLSWELQENDLPPWDERARPYLETYLSLHTPYAGTLSPDAEPTEAEIARSLTRQGAPTGVLDGRDFDLLLDTLGCAGYGWLHPDRVQQEVVRMAQSWQGPPLRVGQLQRDWSSQLQAVHTRWSPAGHAGNVTAVAVSPDGRWGLSGGQDGTVKRWDLVDRTGQSMPEASTRPVTVVVIAPDCQTGLSGSADGTLRSWDLERTGCTGTWQGHPGGVSSIAMSGDGQLILSGGRDGTLHLWAQGLHTPLRALRKKEGEKGHPEGVTAVAISLDGRIGLSGGYDKTLYLWELTSGKWLRTLGDSDQLVTAVAISPDGRFGLSGSQDGTLRWWNLANGACLKTCAGGIEATISVAICFGNQIAFSVGRERTIQVWELASGKSRRITNNGRAATCFALSPDRRLALLGCSDGTVNLLELTWDLDSPDPADWDEGARPYLEAFLFLHTPRAGMLPHDREPTAEETSQFLTRQGPPAWAEDDFLQLLDTLRRAGYGWLRPEGVQQVLASMAEQLKEKAAASHRWQPIEHGPPAGQAKSLTRLIIDKETFGEQEQRELIAAISHHTGAAEADIEFLGMQRGSTMVILRMSKVAAARFFYQWLQGIFQYLGIRSIEIHDESESMPRLPEASAVPLLPSHIASTLPEIDYWYGAKRLQELVREKPKGDQASFRTLRWRLYNNLFDEKKYGPTENLRADRARITEALEDLAARLDLGLSFMDLCMGKETGP